MSSGLPREILKWLQSLDLSYSVKNPRRDFSNGFLIAEIFSRYYQYDIQLHSYDNGSSLKKKLDNWHLLEKFFNKRGIEISREQMDGCVHNKDGAALELIEYIYSALTNRNIATLKANNNSEATPGYAKATTSNLIKENIKDSEVKVSETLATQAKAQQIVEEHTEQLKAQRKMDIIAGDKRHERVETRQVGLIEEDGPQMQFNEVKVKAVDKSVSQLRASMDQTAGRSGGPSRMSATTAQPTEHGGGGGGGGAGGPPVKPVLDTLSQALANKLQGDEVMRSMEGRKDAIVAFVEEQMATVPADVVTAVFQDLQTKCGAQVVNTMLSSPREFWTFLSTFLPALAAKENHREGRSAALGGFISAIGMKSVERDPRATWEMFVDFGLTKLASLLKKSKSGRGVLLQVLYSFCAHDVAPHIAAIKALQDALQDQQEFMHCLAVLVTLESTFNEDMLDLYLYYCVIGLGMPSQQLRAACLSILPVAAIQNPELVLSKMDLLAQAGQTEWWEVHAQLVVVLATLLDMIDADHAQAPSVYALLTSTLAKCSSPDVLRIALSYLAPCLCGHQSIAQLYAGLLFDIPFAMLTGNGSIAGLLNDSTVHALSVPADMLVNHYRLISLPSEWNSITVASAVANEVRSRGLVNLSQQHVEILKACVRPGINHEDKEAWGAVLNDLKDFLYVAMCDADVCTVAIDVMRDLFSALEPSAVEPTFETLMKSLRLIYPSGDESCRAAVAEFLNEVLNMRGEYRDALTTGLEALPEEIKSSPELAALMA